MWLAGGAVKNGFSFGATDDFGFRSVQDVVHVHDLHATILHLMGFDHEKFTYRYAESFYDMKDPDWAEALKAWGGLEARAQSDIERQTMRLHEANVLITMGRNADAGKVLDTVTDPRLDLQKQKLVARLAPDKGR